MGPVFSVRSSFRTLHPRSTARGWLAETPTVVVCLDVTELTEPELLQEVLKLRRRVRKITALLRLALAVLQTSGFRLTVARLPDGGDKLRTLRAVDRAREHVPLRALLRFLRVSPSRFQLHCMSGLQIRRYRQLLLSDNSRPSRLPAKTNRLWLSRVAICCFPKHVVGAKQTLSKRRSRYL